VPSRDRSGCFAINPLAVSLYRDRHSVARKKSDAGDALVLAHILRTDQSAHRALPADSELAQAVAVLACAQEDAVWDRTCAHNKLRSLLREYYPGNHRGVRRQTPRPAPLGRPRRPRRRSYPARGREAQQDPTAGAAATRRPTARIDAEADRLQAMLRAEYLHQPLVFRSFC
jgi:transposase